MATWALITIVQKGDKPMNANRQATVTKGNNKERTMKLTASNLIRWAGIAAMVAGIFYVVVGLFHPLETLSSATTPRWIIVHALATAMCFFGLLGMAGLYARQVKETGWLGLAGYLLLSLFYALTAPFTFVEAVILPLWATTAPTFVEGFLGLFNGHPGEINLAVLAAIYALSGIVYIFGGLLFGFATFRAGILPRWPAGLLAVGAALSPAAALLPQEYKALVAVPVGLALTWLGYALWSERCEQAAEPVSGSARRQVIPTAVK
jgi:hypothetical protein